MRTRLFRRAMLLACLTALAMPLAASAQSSTNRGFYAIDDKSRLLSFNQSTPNTVTTRALAGLPAGVQLHGIDQRPATGELFGLGSDSRIYTINPTTGSVTPKSATPFSPALRGSWFGFDFNPVVDRIRIVSDEDQNLRVNPETGQVVMNPDGTFGDGNLNPGDPFVTGAAYTNSSISATPPAATTLYGMEALQDAIVIQAPPNAGTIGTFRYLGKNVLRVAGFDIAGAANTGYIATRTGAGGARLLRVNLANGSNVDLGRIGAPGSTVTALAARQDVATP